MCIIPRTPGRHIGRIHGLWRGDRRPVAQLRTPGPTEDRADDLEDGADDLVVVAVEACGAGAA